MGRKQSSELGKKEEILIAAQTLFLEKGFDGTSIRAIMKEAGGEIGLFYYYFRNKDHVFDCVLDRFFAAYEKDFTRIVAQGRRNPCRLMEVFFEYVETQTVAFRKGYATNMHRTVRWAIREHTMEIIEPYLRQIVEIQSAYYGMPPAIEPDVAALYLTYGVCSAILHEDTKRYLTFREGIKQGVSLLMGMPMDEQGLRIPFPATKEDLPGWMALLWSMEEPFSGFDQQEYREQLASRIAAGEAWVVHGNKELAGVLLYSKDRHELDFVWVRPAYRRHGIASRLVETVAAQFPVGTTLSAVTPVDGDHNGVEAVGFLKALGFVSAGAVETFGEPRQRLTVALPDGPLNRRFTRV